MATLTRKRTMAELEYDMQLERARRFSRLTIEAMKAGNAFDAYTFARKAVQEWRRVELSRYRRAHQAEEPYLAAA